MNHLTPPFILSQWDKQQWHGQLDAAVLFIDISGFTQLTEVLLQEGRIGAETLSLALNDIFQPIVQEIYRHGGFVAAYAGDSVTAVYPDTDNTAIPRMVQTGCLIQKKFARHTIKNQLGFFPISVKIGGGFGSVSWQIIRGNINNCYLFSGQGIKQATEQEKLAKEREFWVSPFVWSIIEGQANGIMHSKGVIVSSCKYEGLSTPVELKTIQAKQNPFINDDIARFVNTNTLGEFRFVSPLFISLAPNIKNKKSINKIVKIILELTEQYQCYFNKITFDDKGVSILILFGAPTAREQEPIRASRFLRALQKQSDKKNWKAGLSYGIAYAGLIGGNIQQEYTAIGDVVNLAARLAQAGDWGQIFVSNEVAKAVTNHFQTHSLGVLDIKGKSQKVTPYLLQEKITTQINVNINQVLVERENELNQLKNPIQQLFTKQLGSTIICFGEAGIGKTRVVQELYKFNPQEVKWLVCEAEEQKGQSYTPFRRLLQSYFDLTEPIESELNKKLDSLIADGYKNGKFKEANELITYRSFLASLFNLHKKNSLYTRITDIQLKTQNLHRAYQAFLTLEASSQPLIIQIENLHWFDVDSLALLQSLSYTSLEQPIIFICSTRDISPVETVTFSDHKLLKVPPLSESGVRQLSEHIVKAQISPELHKNIWERSHGIPLFVEQMLFNMQEREVLIYKDASVDIDPQHIHDTPTSLLALLISRLDRLDLSTKQIIQMSSVIGQTFSISTLEHMLIGSPLEDQLFQCLQKAEEQHILVRAQRETYRFRLSLLRDAAYRMQLNKQLEAFHLLIAQSLSQISAEQSKSEIAYHFARAKKLEEAVKWHQKAADEFLRNYKLNDAIWHFSQALNHLTNQGWEIEYQLLLGREAAYHLLGEREAQEEDLSMLREISQKLGGKAEQATIALRWSRFGESLGELDKARVEAETAVTLSQDHPPLLAKGYLAWGKALWPQGAHDEAFIRLSEALKIATELNDQATKIACLRNLAPLAFFQGETIAAISYLQSVLPLCQKSGNIEGEGATLLNLGNIYSRQTEYEKSIDYYEEALAIFEQIGDTRNQAKVYTNLGVAYAEQRKHDKALQYHRNAYKVYRKIQDEYGENQAKINTAYTLIFLGQTTEAVILLQEAQHLAETTNNQMGQQWALLYLGLAYYQQNQLELAGTTFDLLLNQTQDKHILGHAHTFYGHSLALQSRLQEAESHYLIAVNLRKQQQENVLLMETQAGLARIWWQQGKTEEALNYVDKIMAYAQEDSLYGCVDPFAVYLTCYLILRETHSQKAHFFLDQTLQRLTQEKEEIQNEKLQESFLRNVPSHRTLLDIQS